MEVGQDEGENKDSIGHGMSLHFIKNGRNYCAPSKSLLFKSLFYEFKNTKE